MKQSDVPGASLDEALRIPQTIFDHYAGKPTNPMHLAKALNLDPRGSQLRVLSGAAIAFGLIEGGAQATTIGVTQLAKQIVRPTQEGDETRGKREAILRPRVFGEFLDRYNGHPFPRRDIAQNVLEELGVPREKTEEVLDRIEISARSVGLLETIKAKTYVMLDNTQTGTSASIFDPPKPESRQKIAQELSSEPGDPDRPEDGLSELAEVDPSVEDQRHRRVFITHGRDRALVDPIRKLLGFGELEAVVSVERQTVSKPVPEKVMDDMRRCGAAIIHVDADEVIVDKDGREHVVLNPNVMIEIGAAMAFYGRRFILLVREGVKLPSNLQGLYEVRYPGETLDAGATIALLEAMNDIKNHPLPT